MGSNSTVMINLLPTAKQKDRKIAKNEQEFNEYQKHI